MDLAPLTLAQLKAVVSNVEAEVWGDGSVLCTHVTQDSRRVRPGAMFAVVSGGTQDGSSYVQSALDAGARSLLLDRSTAREVLPRYPDVAALIVEELAPVLGPVSHAALGHPARDVAVTGITGTNGKTTIVGLLRQCFDALGYKAASLGTLGYCTSEQTVDFGMTTPNADLVAEYIHSARLAGVAEFAMEVSSHALALGRVEGFVFEVGGYVNLTQDHLDFHGTFENYSAAKQKLFEAGRCRRAVIQTDDPNLAQLASRLLPNWGGSLLRVGRGERADLRLTHLELGLHETRFTVECFGELHQCRTKLLGEHNVANWLVALGVLQQRGVSLKEVVPLMSRVEPAPGRLQRCDTSDDEVCVLVDYAHTPDALERALVACRALRPKAIWCVFGCGGDRDRGKRPLMGEVSARLADVTVVTNDNPRTEQAEEIAAEIRAGISGREPWVMLDRAQAIDFAIQNAAPGDLVLIAGKGHENYQIFGRAKVHFDDREVAEAALVTRRHRATRNESPSKGS